MTVEIREQLARAMSVTKFVTATATLTESDVHNFARVAATHASSAIAITLPVAGANLKGKSVRVIRGGAAAVTVVSGANSAGTAGFAGAGASYDTVTLGVQGEEAEFTVVETAAGTYAWTYTGATGVAA